MGQDKEQESDGALTVCLENGPIVKELGNKYKCSYTGCNSVFRRPSRLDRHIRTHLGERPYICTHPGCDKAYTNSSHLKRHANSHTIIKLSFKCTVCSMTLGSKCSLKRHYNRAHGDNIKLTCQDCNIRFVKKHQLVEHRATYHNIPLKCEKCNTLCATKQALAKHKAVHNGKKKYLCPAPGCNEVFDKWLVRCAHVKTQHVIHYKCTVCGNNFLNKTHLKHHSVIHKADRPVLPCPYEMCPRSYYFKSNLDHHIKVRHLDNKFVCDICNIKIASKQKLREHIQKLHMSDQQMKKTKRQTKKLNRKKRKDIGTKKKSEFSSLVGIIFPPKVEELIIRRKSTIEYSAEPDASISDHNSL